MGRSHKTPAAGGWGRVYLGDESTDQVRGLSPRAYRIRIVLHAMADLDGVAYPSQAFMAEITGYTRTTVSKAVRELVNADLLFAVPYGDGRRLKYRLLRSRAAE